MSTPRYSSDRPNKPPDPDLLGRDAFAQRLASDIKAWKSNDSLVIALYGSWGCGKTSLKERILSHLQATEEDYPIVDFNPWQLSGSGNLAMAYFRELDAILKSGKAGEHSAKAAKRLATYTRHLSLLGTATKWIAPLFAAQSPELAATISMAGEGVNQIGEVTRKASQALQEEVADRSLDEIKKALFEAMAEIERPILVVIDDIDRLTESEILEIFQLVKINADFPNLIYLLLFDRPVVADALNKASPGRGKQYLEKIVQVPYHMPEAPLEKIRELLGNGINASMEGPGIEDRWEKERWQTLFFDGMAAYFKNLRHVYRFLGSFDFQVRHFQREDGFEVNPVDLLGLETLRVFEAELYEKLFSSKALLTGDYGRGLWTDPKEEEVRASATKLLSIVPEETRAFARNIIQTLFPPSSGGRRDGYSVDQWLRQARVCHSEIFDKYFTLQIAASDLGQVELERLVKIADNREKFTAAMRELERHGLIDKAMERLEAYKQEIPLSSMPGLTLGLCDCADSFKERRAGFFDFDSLVHALRIVYFGLLREPDASKRLSILEHAIKQTSGIVLPVRIVSGEERRKEMEERDHQYLINENQVEHLKELCVQKLWAAARSGALKTASHGAMLLWRWSEWDSIDAVRGWVTTECEKNGATPWLLATLTSEGAVNGKPFHYLNWSTLNRFVDPQLIKARVSELDETVLNDRERIGLQQFRRALKRKETGKPDLTGHEWRDEE